MPLRTLLRFRNPDVTSDLNAPFRNLVSKGVFYGGQVIPVAGTLDVQVPNMAVMGADGMVTLLEGATEQLTCTPGVTQWVLLHAYYVNNADAVAELEVLSTTLYDALSVSDKQHRVKLASVSLAPAATEVTTADISFTDSDQVDPLGRSPFRGAVEQATELPDYTDPATGLTTQNREHDIYFVQDERLFYSWDESTGTAQWRPVISAAEELALANHKNNLDDGTVAPDFYNSQHVLVKHRESLDEGSASTKLHGTDGTDFGSGNAIVDEALPTGVLSRVDVTGLAPVASFQLTGTFQVGTGAIGTATAAFQLANYQTNEQLQGSDRGPIRISEVRRSDDSFELDPANDADALGYYTDPYIHLDFSETSDGTVSGDLSVYATLKRTAGTIQPADGAVGNVGVGFIRTAHDVPVVGDNFVEIPAGTDDVQEALEALDSQLSGLAGGAAATLEKIVGVPLAGGPDPDTLRWYGGTGNPLGYLGDEFGVNPEISTAGGTPLVVSAPLLRIKAATTPVHAAPTDTLLRLEGDSGDAFISFATNTTRQGLYFGDPDSATSGSIIYDHSVTPNTLDIRMNTYRRLRLKQNGQLFVGSSLTDDILIEPSSLTLVQGNGRIVLSQTLTTGTSKRFRIVAPSYDSDPLNHGVLAIYLEASTNSNLRLGGGTTAEYAVETLSLWTAPDHTTQQGTRRLNINNAGEVAIGDDFATPLSRLHVRDSAAAGSVLAATTLTLERNGTNYISFLSGDAASAGLRFASSTEPEVGGVHYNHNTDLLVFRAGNAVQMSISDTSVNCFDNDLYNINAVGIGGAVGDTELYVYGDATVQGASTTATLNIGDFVGDRNCRINFRAWDTGNTYDARCVRVSGENGAFNLLQRGTGQLALKTEDAAQMAFVTSNVRRMLITPTGEVAIGTHEPAMKFEVRQGWSDTTGNAPGTVMLIENDDDVGLEFQAPADKSAMLSFSRSGGLSRGQIRYSYGTDTMTFYANVNARMTLLSTGGVEVGTELGSIAIDGGAMFRLIGWAPQLCLSDTAVAGAYKLGEIVVPSRMGDTHAGVIVASMYNSNADNTLRIGGGSTGNLAATVIRCYTGTALDSSPGTEKLTIDSAVTSLVELYAPDGIMAGASATPSAHLHVRGNDGAYSSYTPTTVDTAILENNGDCILTIAAKNDSESMIRFADNVSTVGAVSYDHATETLRLHVSGYDSTVVQSNRTVVEALQLRSQSSIIHTSVGDLSLVANRPYISVTGSGDAQSIPHVQKRLTTSVTAVCVAGVEGFQLLTELAADSTVHGTSFRISVFGTVTVYNSPVNGLIYLGYKDDTGAGGSPSQLARINTANLEVGDVFHFHAYGTNRSGTLYSGATAVATDAVTEVEHVDTLGMSNTFTWTVADPKGFYIGANSSSGDISAQAVVAVIEVF